MSKRAPGSTLTQENWDNEEKNEDQGTWNRAKESTLKERVIMRAKRRGPAESKGMGSAFGGLSAKLGNKKDTAAFSFAPKKEEEKKEEEKPEVKSEDKLTTSDKEIEKLNKSLLEWIEAHVKRDPICDFRPVFNDYKNYMDKIDKRFGNSWIEPTAKTNGAASSTSTDEVKKPSFSFGKTEEKRETTKPSFSFGSSSSEKKDEPAKPVFSFGKKPDSDSKEEKKEAPKFSFGGSKPDSEKEPPKFSFGSKNDSSKKEDEPTKPSGGFFANLGGDSKPSGGFSFNTAGSTSSFTFKPSATGSAAPTSGTTEGGDEEYVPPVAETKEFDDAKDALYQKKSKIFYLKDGNYKEIGVGLLFVKPLDDDKASILVRADNTLGNILLNVAIPPSPAPVKQGKNNCLLPVVLNPPVDGVEGAVPLLIRVKTSDDADELIEVIKSKQS